MANREQKIKELMEGMQSLRRHSAFGSLGSAQVPRITPAQWSVLFLLEAGPSTVTAIAAALGVTSSAATQLTAGLIKSGYLLRTGDRADRRVALLALSKKTKAQVGRMKKEVLKNFLKLFEVLSEKEFNQYLALNKKIVERFSKQS